MFTTLFTNKEYKKQKALGIFFALFFISPVICLAYSTTGDKTFITDPLDTTAPANVSGLQIVFHDDDKVELSWVNPPDIDFDSVRIMHSTVFYPDDPVDGMVVYEGDHTEVIDTEVIAGVKYYYTIFAKDVNGNYSSGAIGSIEIPVPPAEPVDEPVDEPTDEPTEDVDDTGLVDDDGGTGSGDSKDEDISDSDEIDDGEQGDEDEDSVPLPDVPLQTFEGGYVQNGEVQLFQQNQEVQIDASYNFTISVSLDQTPENAELIIATITNIQEGSKNEYLLRLNQDKTAYEAVVPALTKGGKYNVDIVVYNSRYQPTKKLSNMLNVLGAHKKITPYKEYFNPTIQKVVTYTGVSVGAAQVIVLATQITSLMDFWLIILRFFSSLFGFFSKRKKEQWGVVYDSATKRPLDLAYIKIQKEGQNNKTAISDIDGHYGFLVPYGSYTLNVDKTYYKFPSEKFAGQTEDELYDNLYFGGPIEINADTSKLIQKNIPLDPIDFDWNEYIKQQKNLFVSHLWKKQALFIIAKLIFFAGFAFSAYALWLDPSLMFNCYIFILYIFIFLIQLIQHQCHKVTQLVDKNTDLPIPFAIIKAYFMNDDRLLKKVVSDEFGNFYLLTPPGIYYFTIEKKLADGSYSQPYRTKPISLKKGVVLKNLYLL
ncbi:fibronectin type III domain-containing protein [Patescibacteria group bacterium]|nr:fibronectin type III domain-containing protein [Patescibacteria group bacterium]